MRIWIRVRRFIEVGLRIHGSPRSMEYVARHKSRIQGAKIILGRVDRKFLPMWQATYFPSRLETS